MKKCVIIYIFIILALSICSCQITSDPQAEPNETAVSLPMKTVEPSTEPSLEAVLETPSPMPDDRPAVRLSTFLEENSVVLNENDAHSRYDASNFVYLYADDTIYNLFVSTVIEREGEAPSKVLEESGNSFTPQLSSGQAVRILVPYPDYTPEVGMHSTKIAYENGDGEYEVFLIQGNKEENEPSLLSIKAEILEQATDGDYYRADVNAEFDAKVKSGAFAEYVPQGLCIAYGRLGDVNGDGVQDALLCLSSSGPRVETGQYSGPMPLFVLTGQADGGYIVAKISTDALYTPYRSSFYALAGDGYIDVVYELVDGAACHHTSVHRFAYAPERNDWLLTEFSNKPSYVLDYSEEEPPAFVEPLPDFALLPLADFKGGEFYDAAADWDSFDAVVEATVTSWGDFVEIYTLAVNFNESAGTYEGYIHKYYKSFESGGFIHTISGEYDGAGFSVAVDEKNVSFIVQNDIWTMDEHDEDAFHLSAK